MKKIFVWRNAFVCLLGVLLAFAVYQHFWAKRISAQSTTSTRILIPVYTGSDSHNSSNLVIENTSMDPFGTTASNGGSCNLDLYSNGVHYGPAELDGNVPGAVNSWSYATLQTQQYIPTLPNSSVLSYIFLTCNFPYAHAGVEVVNSSGVVTFIPGYIIPPNRSFATGPEQLLQ